MHAHAGERQSRNRPGDFGVWLALVPAMALPFLASLFYFVLFSEHLFARLLYGGTKLFLLIWPLLALRCILRESFRWGELWPSGSWRALGWGGVSGLGIVAAMGLLQLTALGEITRASAPSIRLKVQTLGIERYYWTFGLFLALFHSFLEEYYWRWFVFGRLRRVAPRRLAHLVAGAAFAAHHVVITTQYFPWGWGCLLGGATGLGGMLWSWMYERQKSLAGAWISHVLADLGILALGHHILFGTWW